MDSSLFEVTAIGDAANKGYTQSIIVNQAGKDVSKLQELLTNPSVVDTMPEGEASSQADIVVIISQ